MDDSTIKETVKIFNPGTAPGQRDQAGHVGLQLRLQLLPSSDDPGAPDQKSPHLVPTEGGQTGGCTDPPPQGDRGGCCLTGLLSLCFLIPELHCEEVQPERQQDRHLSQAGLRARLCGGPLRHQGGLRQGVTEVFQPGV